MSKKHKHKAGRRRYTIDNLYHVSVDDSDVAAPLNDTTWHEALCGKFVQFGKQLVRWPWCPECQNGLDVTIGRLKAKPKSIKSIVEQQFSPSSALLERIQRENKVKPVIGVVQKPLVGSGAAAGKQTRA